MKLIKIISKSPLDIEELEAQHSATLVMEEEDGGEYIYTLAK